MSFWHEKKEVCYEVDVCRTQNVCSCVSLASEVCLGQTAALDLSEQIISTTQKAYIIKFSSSLDRFRRTRTVVVWEGEGKMEGKCRPHTVQRRLQSEVEDCDWWKEQHLCISFIHLNSCESHECSASVWQAAGREVQSGISTEREL